jgi:hypothetical protein
MRKKLTTRKAGKAKKLSMKLILKENVERMYGA